MNNMTIDISMFFQFPGILITIGVVLLLISIIIIIVAYKTEQKEIDAASLSVNDIYNNIVNDQMEKQNNSAINGIVNDMVNNDSIDYANQSNVIEDIPSIDIPNVDNIVELEKTKIFETSELVANNVEQEQTSVSDSGDKVEVILPENNEMNLNVDNNIVDNIDNNENTLLNNNSDDEDDEELLFDDKKDDVSIQKVLDNDLDDEEIELL